MDVWILITFKKIFPENTYFQKNALTFIWLILGGITISGKMIVVLVWNRVDTRRFLRDFVRNLRFLRTWWPVLWCLWPTIKGLRPRIHPAMLKPPYPTFSNFTFCSRAHFLNQHLILDRLVAIWAQLELNYGFYDRFNIDNLKKIFFQKVHIFNKMPWHLYG